MAVRKLQVVDAHASHESDIDKTALDRVFEHWVWMLGKNPRRTALGPTRRRAIERALGLYDEETLLLAVEGCAASAWHNGRNDREREFNDLELIMRDEAHIERFAADGERLRDKALRLAEQLRQATAEMATLQPAPTADEVVAQREALRSLAARIAGRRVLHG